MADSQSIITKYLSQGREQLLLPMSLLYLSLIIIASIVFGQSVLLYAAFAFVAAIFILPRRDFLGLFLIAALTMVFERFFALQGLVIDRTTYKFYLLDIVIALTFCAAWLRDSKAGKIRFKWNLTESAIAAFMVIVAIWQIRSLFDINADFDLSFSSFKNYCFYPLAYFLVLMVIDSAARFKKFIHLLLLAGCGLIGFILFGFVNGNGLWTEFTPLSTSGVRYLAGTHAFYLMITLLILAALIAYRRLRQPAAALIIAGLWTLGLAVSLMRHLWLAAAVGLAALIIAIGREQKKYLSGWLIKAGALAISGLMAFLAFNPIISYYGPASQNGGVSAIFERAASVLDLSSDTSATWRNGFWREAKNAWVSNPLFGIGFGHQLLIEIDGVMSFEEIKNIHNSPLAITVQMGLIGLASFILIIIFGYSELLKGLKISAELEPYLAGLGAALAAIIAAMFFQPYLETNLMGIWFWLILGLIKAGTNIARQETAYENTASQ